MARNSDDEMDGSKSASRSASPEQKRGRSPSRSQSRSPSRSQSRGSKGSRGSRSRSRSRSRSEAGSRNGRSGGDGESGGKVTLTMDLENDDAAFILGRGGATKRKIARVSGADIDLDEKSLVVTMAGTRDQCEKAGDYISFIKQQRVGPVTIDTSELRDDFTAYTVPGSCIGASPSLAL